MTRRNDEYTNFEGRPVCQIDCRVIGDNCTVLFTASCLKRIYDTAGVALDNLIQ